MSSADKIKELKEDQCVVDVLLKEVQSHPCQNCGKCVFGYEGITQLEMILKDITEKKGRSGDKALMEDLAEMMKTQSLCEDGEDIADAVKEALGSYGEIFDEHISKKGCRAGVCKKFMTYHILASKCVGCGECMDVCEDDAILGKNKFVHVIVMDECSLCGKCMEACDEDAIVMAGAQKPKCPTKPIPCKR
ncbi:MULTISPECIES: NADH-ubiquinone oxidoreductase-F iron-sulfur binding region domain-containing protein [unclassified Butyrivibrio]|uniref:NADH-ubiquinone oxidoreductase-F iron-sulfur binding region domain-containing protein n=1 Tax=unclassified Butyrivibrio TaxID=2639466 RepID=UPI0003B578AB|nr:MULTISPECIES: NADH-ubiquinone oxidoreductase-F iron-sulfur binding region domain-containing protein [unclassified Butyrivibrio]SEL27222.1 NADH-quinone oxidoreductase subunit F [Butyrivibrio sp. ob235]